MLRRRGQAPTWLYSFVDLAFLLLIAMSQIDLQTSTVELDLGEMELPRIRAGAATDLPRDASERFQVRVHPPAESGSAPFALVRRGSPPHAARLGIEQLSVALAALHSSDAEKPLLAPHEDARAKDMLDAVAVLEDLWPHRRHVTIAPVSAMR